MVAEVSLIGMDDTDVMKIHPYIFELQFQAMKLYCRARSKSNPENTFGLASLQGPLCMHLDTTTDIDRILHRVQGVNLGGTLNFQNGVGYTQVAFIKRCPNGMRKRMLIFVGVPLNSSKADMEELGRFLKDKDIAVDVWFRDTMPIRHRVKKERLEAFVVAVNNNHHSSHIAYLDDGCDVRQVLTESGILTRAKKDVSGLAPALASLSMAED